MLFVYVGILSCWLAIMILVSGIAFCNFPCIYHVHQFIICDLFIFLCAAVHRLLLHWGFITNTSNMLAEFMSVL